MQAEARRAKADAELVQEEAQQAQVWMMQCGISGVASV